MDGPHFSNACASSARARAIDYSMPDEFMAEGVDGK